MLKVSSIVRFLFLAVFIPISSSADSESFKVLKIYSDLETDTAQPWMQDFPGRCTEKCQTEFNKCVQSQATKKNCDGRLYKITGVYTYEFPCGEKEIWLMEFSESCKSKGNPNLPTSEFTGQMTCVAADTAKRCEMAGDGCAADCRNNRSIDRDLSLGMPSSTAKQRGIVRPAPQQLDIRRE